MSPTKAPAFTPPARVSPPTRAQQLRAAAVRAFMQQSCRDQFPSPRPEASHCRNAQHAALQHKPAAGAEAEAATSRGAQGSDEGSVGSCEGGVPRMAGLARWVAAQGIDAAGAKGVTSEQHTTGRLGRNGAHNRIQPDAVEAALTESTAPAQHAQHAQHGAQQAQRVQQPLQMHQFVYADSSFRSHTTAHDPQSTAGVAADANDMSDRSSHMLHGTKGSESQPGATSQNAVMEHGGILTAEQSEFGVHVTQHNEEQQTQADFDQESAACVNPEVAQLVTDFSKSQLAEFEQSCTSERLVAIHVRSERSMSQM